MAQEFKIITATGTIDPYGVILNNDDKSKGYNTTVNDGSTYTDLSATNTNIQVAFSDGYTYGGDKIQYANLPTGLDETVGYQMLVFSSGHSILGYSSYEPLLIGGILDSGDVSPNLLSQQLFLGNITVTGTTIPTTGGGGGGLTQADIRTAIGMSAANLDTQLSNLSGNLAIIPTGTGAGGSLSAADIRAAVGLAYANLDLQLDTLSGYALQNIALNTYLSGNLPTATGIRWEIDENSTQLNQILADVQAIPTGVDGLTLQIFFNKIGAILCGKSSGNVGTAPYTETFRSINDNSNEVSVTTDANYNRTAANLNP